MIEARRLGKRYGDAIAVHDLSFEVVPGVVYGLLGPNGAGKSTTLRLILGLDRPTAGTVTVGGRPYRDSPAPMREVGALLDAKAVHGKRTARAHLRWLAEAGGLPRARVAEVLDQVGLAPVAGKHIRGFSLGMLQRLGIAAALLGDPRTLLFDEPLNGLDAEGIRWVRTLVRGLAAEGRTVVLSSHLMSEVEATADHVLVIGRGRLLADTSVREFTQRSAGSHVRVVSPDAGTLGALLERAGGSRDRRRGRRPGRRRDRDGAGRRPRGRARAAAARAHAAPGHARGGVHGAHGRQRRVPRGAGRVSTVRSEWTKLVSLRSTAVLVAVGLLLGIGLTAGLAVVAGVTWQDWDAADRRSFEPIGFALIGGVPSALIFIALGAKVATSEYGSGMIRLTLTATPRRGRVLAAKAAVVTLVTLAVGLALNVGMVAVAQAIFASYGIESAGLGDGDLLRAVAAGRRALTAVPGDRARPGLHAAQHGRSGRRRVRAAVRPGVPRRVPARVVVGQRARLHARAGVRRGRHQPSRRRGDADLRRRRR